MTSDSNDSNDSNDSTDSNDRIDRAHLVCVARYTEPVDWISTLGSDVVTVVYDKGNGSYPNVGREAETFARCIVEMYGRLESGEIDVITFLQGFPFDHAPIHTLVGSMKSADGMSRSQKTSTLIPHGTMHVSDRCGRPDHPGLPVGDAWRVISSIPGFKSSDDVEVSSDTFNFVAGAQYTVGSNRVVQHSVEFWKTLHQLLFDQTVCPWTMERFWMRVFHM